MKKIVALLILLFSLFLYYIWYILNVKITYDEFLVKNGDTVYNIVNKICGSNILKCNILKAYVKYKKVNSIKPGNYTFSGDSIDSFFKKLEKGPPIRYKDFTILPSWTKYDIAYVLGAKNGQIFLKLIDDIDFINKLKSKYAFLKDFGNISTLEGFIYPDTYKFKYTDFNSYLFSNLLIKTALGNFGKKWNKLIKSCDNSCNPYKLTNYEILIMASIVEKEEKNNNKNKPYIADILIRRYKYNWKIGADWTLCYGLKVRSIECKNYLYNRYLKDKSNLYNTRAVKGLPPSPVGNPSAESIKAVLYPIKNYYWYYLHDKYGNIHFGKDSQEHIINKKKYLK